MIQFKVYVCRNKSFYLRIDLTTLSYNIQDKMRLHTLRGFVFFNLETYRYEMNPQNHKTGSVNSTHSEDGKYIILLEIHQGTWNP